MRTLHANLEAVNNGTYNAIFRAKLWQTTKGGGTPINTTDITYFKLDGLTLTATIANIGSAARYYTYIQLFRGAVINGGEYTVGSSYYKIFDSKQTQRDSTFYASLIPNIKISIAGDATYENVLTAFATACGLTASFKDPTAAHWDYQYLPAGKQLILNDARGITSQLQQKYLITASDQDDDVIRFSAFSEQDGATSSDMEDVPFLFNDFTIYNFRSSPVQYIWRDEADTTHQDGELTAKVHNLGYLESTDSPPASHYTSNLYAYNDQQVDLRITTNDTVSKWEADHGEGYSKYMTAKVLEVFDPKHTPSWRMDVEGQNTFSNTEGGALPSTIERVAAYTPLVSTGFDGNLTPAVNNLQALAQAVDDMPPGVTNGDSHDHSGGDGARIISAVQILFTHGLNGQVPASTTQYLMPGPVSGLQAAVSNIQISEAVTASKLYFTTNATQPASGSLVVTVLKNNVATALTITIAASAVAATFSDTTNSVSFTAGDSMTIEVKNNATAASANVTRGSALIAY